MTEESIACISHLNLMNITDCVKQIKDALVISVEGKTVYPEDFPIKDGWGIGFKFACPYCCHRKQRPSKKREKCARIYPVTSCYAYRFSCNKCNQSMSIHKFLEDKFPCVYQRYKREKMMRQKDYRPKFND